MLIVDHLNQWQNPGAETRRGLHAGSAWVCGPIPILPQEVRWGSAAQVRRLHVGDKSLTLLVPVAEPTTY
jgi:hypothetical protein